MGMGNSSKRCVVVARCSLGCRIQMFSRSTLTHSAGRRLSHQMSEDCRDTYRDDYELYRRCEAVVGSNSLTAT